jgi:hypothetical protein
MTKENISRDEGPDWNKMDLRHMRRDARTALELAVVALAPSELVDRLAMSTGLLEALAELPVDSAPVRAIAPRVLTRARGAVDDWQKWQAEHVERVPRT